MLIKLEKVSLERFFVKGDQFLGFHGKVGNTQYALPKFDFCELVARIHTVGLHMIKLNCDKVNCVTITLLGLIVHFYLFLFTEV